MSFIPGYYPGISWRMAWEDYIEFEWCRWHLEPREHEEGI